MNESTLNLILFIGPVLLVAVLLMLWFGTRTTTRRWNKHKAETVSRWEAEGVQFVRGPTGGQFGGLESTGMKKVIRGIGFAALTDKDLRVTRSSPSRAWIIPFKQMRKVVIQNAFLGKRVTKNPFIVVHFKKKGQADKLGFLVKEPEAWAADIAQAADIPLENRQQGQA